MTAARPTTVLAISLAVLVLGLAALLYGPAASLFVEWQLDIWRRLGAPGVTRPAWAIAVEIGFLAVTGSATIFLMLRTRLYWAGLFVLVALVTDFYCGFFLSRTQGIGLDVLAPGTILFLTFAAGGAILQARIGARRRELRFAFADSLPRADIERIARDPDLLSLEGTTRDITYLVCGLRGLAELAAAFQSNPKAYTRLLEQVLTPLMAQSLRHGGVIDRLTPEGFTAYWNAPLDDPDHALHACEAASGMATVLARTNNDLAAGQKFGGPALPPVEIGIGIATGPVVAGGFSGHGRLSYSVNGDAVRLAARLQALSRNYGPTAIVAEETQKEAARGFAFLEVDHVAQSRDDPPVRLYAMLDNPTARGSPKIRALVTFHEHIFRSLRAQQWENAKALVEQCSRLSGACQTLYDLYLVRIRYFESHPPCPNWDGVFRPILK